MKNRFALFAVCLILCIGVGIWVGISAYLNSGSFPQQPEDWRWFLFYGGMLLFGFSTVWLRHGKFLLNLTISLGLLTVTVTTVRAGLVKEFLAFIFILVTSFSLGQVLFRFLIKEKTGSRLEILLLGFPLGLGGFMLLGLCLGLLGAYTPLAAYLTLGFVLIFTGLSSFRLIKEIIHEAIPYTKRVWNEGDFRLFALAVFIAGLFLVGPYLWATAPAVRWDAMSYHVAVPQIYINHQAMVEVPESAQAYWAHYAEMAYTFGMLLGGQPLPGWMHLFTGITSAALTGLLGARLVNGRVGLIATLLFISLPLVNYEIGTAYMEGFTTLFVLAMLFSGFNWVRYRSIRWLIAAGIFSGFALGLKLNAAPFVAAFFILIIIYLIGSKASLNVLIYSVVSVSVPVILLWAPWLIRDALWTGNPIFPNYNWLFNSPKWGTQGLFAVGDSTNKIVEFLKIPWDLVMNTSKYYHEAPGGVLLSLPWIAFPWFLLTPETLDKARKNRLLIILGYAITSTMLLFSIVFHVRYLMPVYPLMAILAAANIVVFTRFIKTSRYTVVAVVAGALLAIGYLLSSQASILIRMPTLGERYPCRYGLGLENKQDFLNRALPFYPVFQYLDQLPHPPKVFSLGVEFRLYTRARIYGGLFSYKVQQILNSAQSPAELIALLQKDGFEYLLVYSPDYYFRPGVYSSKGFTNEFLNKYTQLVAAINRTYLYKLNFGDTSPGIPEANLLMDSGFESTNEISFFPWFIAGNPQLNQSDKYSHTGHDSALLSSSQNSGVNSTVMQNVAVEGGNFYTLDTWSVENEPGAMIQLMIKWVDSDGKILKTDYDWIELTSEWKYYWLSAKAPTNSTRAEVSYAVFGGGSGYLDDASFFMGP